MKTWQGSCHCGKVKYEATLAPEQAMACNCSICGRLGALRTFIPATQFKLLSGENSLTDYQFGKQHIHHVFCSTCGIHPFARGKDRQGNEMISVNLRCLEGFDYDALPVKKFDGKSL